MSARELIPNKLFRMEEDDGRMPITRQATKQKEKKYENDFIGAPSHIKISQLPTKRDVLKYLQKLINDNTTKQGYRVRDIVSEVAEKAYFIWERSIPDREFGIRCPYWTRAQLKSVSNDYIAPALS